MGFNIEEFKGAFDKDFAKSSLFEVVFAFHPNLRFQASSTVLPGTSIQTDVFSKGPYRPVQRPFTRSYSAVPVTFILDNDGECLTALNQMVDRVVDPDGFVSYPYQYLTSTDIYHYDQTGKIVTKYTLNKSFISGISDVSLDWSGGDSVATVSCAIQYRSYTMFKFSGEQQASATFGESEFKPS